MPGHRSQPGASPREEAGRISLAGEQTPEPRGSAGGLPFPRLVSSPEVPFVGGILDVVANVVEHPMSRGAVAGIKHLEEVHCGTDGLLLPSSAPPGQPSHWRRAQSPLQLLPHWSSEHLTTPSNQKNPLKVGMECK